MIKKCDHCKTRTRLKSLTLALLNLRQYLAFPGTFNQCYQQGVTTSKRSFCSVSFKRREFSYPQLVDGRGLRGRPLHRTTWAPPSESVLSNYFGTTAANEATEDTVDRHHLQLEMGKTRRPHKLRSQNVYVRSTEVPPDSWERIVPMALSTAKIQDLKSWFHWLGSTSAVRIPNLDVVVHFDDPEKGAEELLELSGLRSKLCVKGALDSGKIRAVKEHLASCLRLFQDSVSSSSLVSPSHSAAAGGNVEKHRCRARIVASRGLSGIKCPRWHVDHVPLRLICALVGPGVQYVAPGGEGEGLIARDVLNNSDDSSTARVNKAIIKSIASDCLRQAQVGEAVMLVGKAWEDRIEDGREDEELGDSVVINGSEKKGRVLAAVHRSPNLKPDKERVLLTVDIVVPVDNDSDLALDNM